MSDAAGIDIERPQPFSVGLTQMAISRRLAATAQQAQGPGWKSILNETIATVVIVMLGDAVLTSTFNVY